jgi:hypothetical protein
MLDSKQTLIKLHTEFPDLSLDDLLKILDCYTEYYNYYWNNIVSDPVIKPHTYEVTCTDHMYNKFLNKE